MKKILTLMAAMAAAGSAMAHDYNWAVANPTVDETGKVIGCDGLSYSNDSQKQKFTFDADANDEITLTVSSGKNIGVTVDGVAFGVAVEKGEVIFKVENGGTVEITLGENTAITTIKVVSDAKITTENKIANTNAILDARVNNISKFVNIGKDDSKKDEFYKKVRALINKEGLKLPKLEVLLEDFAKNDLMDKAIDAETKPGYETNVTIGTTTTGKSYIMSLLNEIKEAIGTHVEIDENSKDDVEKQKGNILVKAEEAKGKYDAIVNATDPTVKAAKAEIETQKKPSSSDFYKGYSYNRTERWTATSTPSKTNALELFKTYVEDYYTTTMDGALDALNKFNDLTDLEALSAKFAHVSERSGNLQKRYAYEEDNKLSTDKKNYTAIEQLSAEVTKLAELATNGYKDAEGNILFDNTGLDALNTEANELFSKISSTDNKHLFHAPSYPSDNGYDDESDKNSIANAFTKPYKTLSSSIDNIKTTWGTNAQRALKTKCDEIQKYLSEKENEVTTLMQNDDKGLKDCQAKFAALQVRLNNVKEAIKDVSTPGKAYDVATKYHDNCVELDNVNDGIGEVWGATQNAEVQAIIAKNKTAYNDIEALAKALDQSSNEYVARLVKFLNSDFFSTKEEGVFYRKDEKHKEFENTVNESIKTIYDYSAEIKTAQEAAKDLYDKYSTTAGEVKLVTDELSDYYTQIGGKKTKIESTLDKAVSEANNNAYTYFVGDGTTLYTNGHVANVINEINAVKSNITTKAEATTAIKDYTNDLAYKEANTLIKDITTDATNPDEQNYVAKAKAKIESLKEDGQLADDAVGDNVVRKTLDSAKNAANEVKTKFDTYALCMTDLYDIQVKWSVNKAAAATGSDVALKSELESIYTAIQTAYKNLTETDRLNVKKEDFNDTKKDLIAALNKTVDSETYKTSLEINTARDAANTQIANAKDALAELTKGDAKVALQAAIAAAEGTVSDADKTLDTSLADGTFKNQAKTLLKEYKSVDLTKAIEDAKKADEVFKSDYDIAGGPNGEPDGKLDSSDASAIVEKISNREMKGQDYKNFLNDLKKYNAQLQ